MLTLDDEDDILDDVKDAVSIAFERLSIEDGYIDDIKLNKLAYLLIQEENLNISYGWYKYGPAPYHVEEPSRGHTMYVQAKTSDEIRASDSSRMPNLDGAYRSPIEWSYYFTDDIRDQFIDIVTSDTKKYLVRFYDDYAPAEYEHLYMESARLQQDLDYIKNNPEWIEDSGHYYRAVKEGLHAVYRELLSSPSVEEAVDPFRDYSRLLEDVLKAADQRDSISEAQQTEVENVINFFHRRAWDWAALLISQITARGDNATALKRGISRDLDDHRTSYRRELESLRHKASERGLIPEHVEELKALEEKDAVIPPDKPESEGLEAWTKAGAEVILNDEPE